MSVSASLATHVPLTCVLSTDTCAWQIAAFLDERCTRTEKRPSPTVPRAECCINKCLKHTLNTYCTHLKGYKVVKKKQFMQCQQSYIVTKLINSSVSHIVEV